MAFGHLTNLVQLHIISDRGLLEKRRCGDRVFSSNTLIQKLVSSLQQELTVSSLSIDWVHDGYLRFRLHPLKKRTSTDILLMMPNFNYLITKNNRIHM